MADGPEGNFGRRGRGGPTGSGGDPAATALGLNGASQVTADAYLEEHKTVLREQADVLRLQKQMLEMENTSAREEQRLQLSHLSFETRAIRRSNRP